jgi:hypothetical protein
MAPVMFAEGEKESLAEVHRSQRRNRQRVRRSPESADASAVALREGGLRIEVAVIEDAVVI